MFFDVNKKEYLASWAQKVGSSREFQVAILALAFLGLSWQIALRWAGLQDIWAQLMWKEMSGGLALVAGSSVLILMLESAKWQSLLRRHCITNLWQRLQVICTGYTFGIFTPNRIGEYGGRLLFFGAAERTPVLTSMLGANIVQYLVNVLIGAFGAWHISQVLGTMIWESLAWPWSTGLLWLVVIGLTGLLAWIIWPALARLIQSGWTQITETWRSYRRIDWWRCAFFALLRFALAALQFFVLLALFGNAPPLILGLIYITGLFGIQTLLPLPSVASLALRTELALFLFEMDQSAVLLSSYILWMFNVLCPALWGITGLFSTRLTRK